MVLRICPSCDKPPPEYGRLGPIRDIDLRGREPEPQPEPLPDKPIDPDPDDEEPA